MTKFLEVEIRLAVGAADADEKRVALGAGEMGVFVRDKLNDLDSVETWLVLWTWSCLGG